MRLSKDILDKDIISVDEGRHLGRVRDLLVDRELTQMTGIFISREGLFRKKTIYIPQEKVVVFGIDAILIESADSKTDSRTTPMGDWIRISTIYRRMIDTPGGTKVGSLGDVIINGTGAIIGFTLGKVAITGTVAQNRSIARASVIDTGHEDKIMTIDLSKAEILGVPDDTMGLYVPSAPAPEVDNTSAPTTMEEAVEESAEDVIEFEQPAQENKLLDLDSSTGATASEGLSLTPPTELTESGPAEK